MADDLRVKIKTGKLKPGQKLRSLKDMAGDYGVGVDTVVDALDLLQHEGLLRTVKRVGTFVVDRPERQAVLVEAPAVVSARMPDPEEARKLGIPPVGVPVLVVRTGRKEQLLAADRAEVHLAEPGTDGD